MIIIIYYCIKVSHVSQNVLNEGETVITLKWSQNEKVQLETGT